MEIRFTFEGWQAADAFLARVEQGLQDLSGAMTHVRDEVRHEIDDVFSNAAGNRPYSWAAWRPWTVEWRNNPPSKPNYYSARSGGGRNLGVWSGDMQAAFRGERRPGYTRVLHDSLEMGIQSTEGDHRTGGYAKEHVFVKGRSAQPGNRSYYAGTGNERDYFNPNQTSVWRVYHQEARAVYENLNLESDGTTNPIARGFRTWFHEEFGLTEVA
jgi:hypothetical protein